MKKFEMPVVVLNEMTMNESIASDCCYKQVTEGYVTTKTVLNGGSIGSVVTYPLKPAVLEAFGSRSNIPNYHYKIFLPTNPATGSSPTIGDGGVIGGGGFKGTSYNVLSFTTYDNTTAGTLTYVAYLDGNGNIAYNTDPAQLAGAVLTQNGGACDHFNSDCPFVTKTTTSNQHIGATMKHLFGGTDWANPHTAMQYNS